MTFLGIFAGGAKPWSKSVLLCSSRRYASTSSSSLSITSFGGRSLRIVESKTNAAAAEAAASSERFEEVAEGQPVSFSWADDKVRTLFSIYLKLKVN